MIIPKYFIYKVNTANHGETLQLEPITRERFMADEGLVSVVPGKWVKDESGIYCSNCEAYWFTNEPDYQAIEYYDYCPACGCHIEGVR